MCGTGRQGKTFHLPGPPAGTPEMGHRWSDKDSRMESACAWIGRDWQEEDLDYSQREAGD